MFEMRQPKYQWGQKVSCIADLRNDGSRPEFAEDALLVAVGSIGEVVNVGHHAEANIPVYLVEFPPGMVVGCFEEELVAL
ncbi:MAG: nitrogen fixation protein NifZ [Sulfuricellaceae bacterium]|jgi:nitrogen fixation protein NifZ